MKKYFVTLSNGASFTIKAKSGREAIKKARSGTVRPDGYYMDGPKVDSAYLAF